MTGDDVRGAMLDVSTTGWEREGAGIGGRPDESSPEPAAISTGWLSEGTEMQALAAARAVSGDSKRGDSACQAVKSTVKKESRGLRWWSVASRVSSAQTSAPGGSVGEESSSW